MTSEIKSVYMNPAGLSALGLAMKKAYISLSELSPQQAQQDLYLLAITTMLPDLIQQVEKFDKETAEETKKWKQCCTYTTAEEYIKQKNIDVMLGKRNVEVYKMIVEKLAEHGITQKVLSQISRSNAGSDEAMWY